MAASTNTREQLLQHLKKQPFVEPTNKPDDPTWHGRAMISIRLQTPMVTWQSQQKPRSDKHGADDQPWLTASEYKDTPATMKHKISKLADLIRASRHTMAYTGAGLSVAAGIAQAANGSTKFKKHVTVEADPTLAHCVLARLNNEHLLHAWVQQNHDGLPQKAGVRQECINEIHGSWYDPSNPVVKYSGTLRTDLCEDMYNQAKISDLCLVLGTSLSGLNADRCPEKTAGRSLREKALGSVIIGPQRTPQDGMCSLRIFGSADEVMMALAEELRLDVPKKPQRAVFSPEVRARVPYDRHGKRSETVSTIWDLSPGANVRVSEYNNIQGAQQPAYMDITPKTVGRVLRRNNETCAYVLSFLQGSVHMKLGLWFMEAAKNGKLEYLPVVNHDAKEEPISAPKLEAHAATATEQKSDAAAKEVSEAPKPEVPDRRFNHFVDVLGLPVSMVQLPPFLRLVQTYHQVNEQQIQWRIQLETPPGYPLAASDFLESVQYDLHPTFQPSEVKCLKAPYEIVRRGWGTFDVGVTITFQPGWGEASEAPLKTLFPLDFEKDVNEKRVPVPKMKINPGVARHITAGIRLRPVETRVRSVDGSVYVERAGQTSLAGSD